MSALNFANSLAAAVTSQVSSQPNQSNNQSNQPTNVVSKRFMHGNNVIFKTGTYKGYYGFVYDFKPSNLDVEFEEEQFIPASQYGPQAIGATIFTQFGEGRVKQKINGIIGLFINGSEMRFDESNVARVVAFMDADGLVKAAKLKNVVPMESGELMCSIEVYQLAYQSGQSSEDVFSMLSNAIKTSGTPKSQDATINVSNVQFPEMYFVLSGEGTGAYSTLVRYIEEQYLITYPKTISIQKSVAKPVNENEKLRVNSNVVITKGPFKGKTMRLLKVHEPNLTVYVDAVARKASQHAVKTKTGEFKTKAITPSDVFYMDMRLKNGKFFEVSKVLADDKIVGLMYDKGLTPLTITRDDIESLQPGFTFTADAPKEQDNESTESNLVADEVEESTESNDEDNDSDVGDAEYADEPKETSAEYVEDDQLKATYKDVERTSVQQITLNATEKNIQTKIQTILKNYGGYNLNVYKVIDNVQSAYKNIKALLRTSDKIGKNFWAQSDERYIVACMVLYELVRTGYIHAVTLDDNTVHAYVTQLMDINYFRKSDINNSIFLKNGWSSDVVADNVSAFLSSKNYYSVYRIMFENCNKLLQQWFEPINIKATYAADVVRPMPLAQGPTFEETRKVIFAKEFFSGAYPTSAKKIVWGPLYSELIDTYKSALQQTINSAKNKSTKDVYTFVLQNLESAPFVMKDLQEVIARTRLQIDNEKYQRLAQLWSSFYAAALAKYTVSQNEKQQSMSELKERRQKVATKRQAIEENNEMRKKFTNLNLSLEEVSPIEAGKETEAASDNQPAVWRRLAKRFKH
jgi:ribosomal protein L24